MLLDLKVIRCLRFKLGIIYLVIILVNKYFDRKGRVVFKLNKMEVFLDLFMGSEKMDVN